MADKGYDANAIRANLRQNGIVSVIPGRANRKTAYAQQRYRDCNFIENDFCCNQASGEYPGC